jgi:hypothetical protein
LFTLVPWDDRLTAWLDARARLLHALRRRDPRARSPGDQPSAADPALPPAPAVLVFRRRADGRVTVDAFWDEADVCELLVGGLAPPLAGVVRLERGRLYIEAANGAAVYVPVGPSPRPGCRRYGRLYLRPADA